MPELPPRKPERESPDTPDLDELVAEVRKQMLIARREGLTAFEVHLPFGWQLGLEAEVQRRKDNRFARLAHIHGCNVRFMTGLANPKFHAYRPLVMKEYPISVARPRLKA